MQRTHKVVPDRHKVVGSKNKKNQGCFALIFIKKLCQNCYNPNSLFIVSLFSSVAPATL